ncbi:hypothetical protein HWV62_29503 [Athelia sp. TMB]|nr:hypothetical protein HWV62_29503 [Athelia sp. TMB]
MMMHPELPVGAFTAAALCLVPLPWHWRARNVSTISLIAWLFASNIIYGVDAIIWRDNAIVLVPIWCDITTKLLVGATVALPACCLCLCIQLERIASPRASGTSAADRTRRRYFDAFMCWGVPLIYMALHYVVQGHRFDIIEVLGCRPALYVSLASLLLQTLPPLLLAALTCAYAGAALLHFFRRRTTFASSLAGLSPARYFRLMLMALAEMALGLTITALDTWADYRFGLRPWGSWAGVHSDWLRVGQFPWLLQPAAGRAWDLGMWWAVPAASGVFFAFFGFGEEAVREYGRGWAWVRRVVFRRGEEAEGMKELASFTKCPSRKMRSFAADAASQKTESTACSPPADASSPLPSYTQSQSMAHKPSLAALLEKPLPGYPVLDIRADPVQPVPVSASQEFDDDEYSLYAATATPTVAEAREDEDAHAGTAHTPDIA